MVLLLGLLLLLDQLKMVDLVDWTRLWPLIVILVGVGQLSENKSRGDNGNALLVMMVGVWLLVCSLRLFDLGYRNGWPLLVVLIGIAHIALPRQPGHRAFGLLLIGVGTVFFASTQELMGLDMSTYWPVLVVLGGLAIIFRSFGRRALPGTRGSDEPAS